MSASVRVALADDHALFRQGVRLLLELQPGIEVVAETDCLAEVTRMVAEVGCDALLLDLRMERSALAAIESLAKETRVIVVTATEDPDDALAALRAGARGVVFKRFAVETLMEALRTVEEGSVWVPPSIQEFVAAAAHPESLTAREREIVRLVGAGFGNARIADELRISSLTVKRHLHHIFRKLGAHTRVDVALYAVRVGLVGTDERSD